jgi:hypothetical protein
VGEEKAMFQFGAYLPFWAFCDCRIFNKLPVFNTRKYSDSPRLQTPTYV